MGYPVRRSRLVAYRGITVVRVQRRLQVIGLPGAGPGRADFIWLIRTRNVNVRSRLFSNAMHDHHTKITRRSFLAKTTANVAALSVVPSSVFGLRGAETPNNKLNIAAIG